MDQDPALRVSTAIYAAGLALHTADHFRRGLDQITAAVLWAGNGSTVLGAVAIALVLARHRSAALVAAVSGLPIAAGVAFVHLSPGWGALSDPFVGGGHSGVTALSWTVVIVEIAGAVALSWSGWRALRREDRQEPSPTGFVLVEEARR